MIGHSEDDVQIHFNEKLDSEVTATVSTIIHSPSTFVSKLFDHVWEVDDEEVLYHGYVLSEKNTKTRGISFKVSYWRHDEEPSESVDYTMPFVELVTDLILGELILQ